MRIIATGLLIGLIGVTGAAAKNLAVPEQDPIITMTFPDNWKSKEIEHGYEAKSAGDEVYFSVKSAPMSEKDQLTSDNVKWMQSNEIEPISKQTSVLDIDGIKCGFVQIAAKDPNGPTQVDFVACPIHGDRLILMTVWGSQEDRAKVKAELDAIESSVKAIK